jgi:hypothetical protein
MRLGLNVIRITAEAERDWQRRMQEPRADFKTRAVARAVKAATPRPGAARTSASGRRAESDPAFDKAIRDLSRTTRQRGGPSDAPAKYRLERSCIRALESGMTSDQGAIMPAYHFNANGLRENES